MRATVLSLFFTLTSAFFSNHVDLVKRGPDQNVLTTGGWALSINNTVGCPEGNSLSHPGFCCPTLLDAASAATGVASHVCCPSTNPTCATSLETTPYCARLNWILWNSTTQASGNGYFCCKGNVTGTNDMTCVEQGNGAVINSGGKAQRLGRPLPPGVTIVESSATTTVVSSLTTAASITSSSKPAVATGGAAERFGYAGGSVGLIAGVMAVVAL